MAGFRRPNLSFKVVECGGGRDDKLARLRQLLAGPPAPTLIYAATRQAVDELAAEPGIIGYHAGMSAEARDEAQNKFMTDPAPVLAATNAFGMGIDRADVRRVIHYHFPGSLEAYYQEAGRAGRDGEAAECILLFSYSDRYIQKFLIDMNNPPAEVVRSLYAELRRRTLKGGGAPIESTMSELLQSVDGDKSEGQLSAALGILEKNGLVERSARIRGCGTLKFTADLKQLSILHQAEATQRSRFIRRAINHYGAELATANEYLIDDLAAVAGLSFEQLRRVLAALSGEVLEWTPGFSGRAMTLPHPETVEPELDDAELEEKRDHEISRLDEVVSYAKTRECRQAALIEYFGEKSDRWRCGCCDRCRRDGGTEARPVGAEELKTVTVILRAASYFDGRQGAGKLWQILSGARNAGHVGGNWHQSHFSARSRGLSSANGAVGARLESDVRWSW